MRLLLAAALVLSACDGGDDSPDAGGTDVGFLDDGCSIDNPPVDSGIALPPCNASNGTGCVVSSGRYCVWSFERDEGSCRCLAEAPKQFGEACDGVAQDCAAGLLCLPINGQPAACHQVCEQDSPVACEPYNTATTLALCTPLQRVDGTITMKFGLCVDRTICNPVIDQCAATETCEFLGGDSPICVTSGFVPLGGDCTREICAKGGICLGLVDENGNPIDPICYEPCDPNAPVCTAGTCARLQGIEDWGVCL